MTLEITQGEEGEVARISQADNEQSLAEKGLSPEQAATIPGAAWLLEHGGLIIGHVEEGSGDIVIDKHIGGDKKKKRERKRKRNS